MPERSDSHQLEGESRRAFEGFLGNLFVYREDNPDYGIDGTVEEFGPDRKATGLRYYVQLKATAAEDLTKALAVSIPMETATLYGDLDLPLLMVRYVGSTKKLYARWWHGRVASSRPQKTDAASMTFRWLEEDEASSESPKAWAKDARAFLDLRSASLPLPFRVGLKTKDPPAGLTESEIELAVRNEMKNRRDVVQFERESLEATMRLSGRLMAIEMPGMIAASYDLGDEYPEGDAPQLATDLMVLLGIAFLRWGQADLAARITSSFFARSTFTSNPDIAMMLAGAMTRARRLPEALAVADDIDESLGMEEPNTSSFFTWTSRQHSRSLSREEARHYEKMMRRRIKRRLDASLQVEAAREMVSLANHFRGKQEPGPAIDLFERAAELDPEYLERPYYWHELGGVFFFADRFDDSAKAYEKAVDLGEEGMMPFLLADALLFAGKYQQSREVFKQALTGEETLESASEYYLKLLLLDFLIDWFDLKGQKRDEQAATSLVAPAVEDPGAVDNDEVIQRCREALMLDGLCNFAWVNLAAAMEKTGDRETSGMFYLNAALSWPCDKIAWAFAFVHLWTEGRFELLPMVLTTGQRMTGGEMLPQINEVITGHADAKFRNEFIGGLSRMLDEMADPQEDGLKVRFVGPGKDIESTVIPGATHRDD
jgi:tetratricopeptide (TPR) repeat protein